MLLLTKHFRIFFHKVGKETGKRTPHVVPKENEPGKRMHVPGSQFSGLWILDDGRITAF